MLKAKNKEMRIWRVYLKTWNKITKKRRLIRLFFVGLVREVAFVVYNLLFKKYIIKKFKVY